MPTLKPRLATTTSNGKTWIMPQFTQAYINLIYAVTIAAVKMGKQKKQETYILQINHEKDVMRVGSLKRGLCMDWLMLWCCKRYIFCASLCKILVLAYIAIIRSKLSFKETSSLARATSFSRSELIVPLINASIRSDLRGLFEFSIN